MNVNLIENLVIMSRPARPATWLATLEPLGRRAGVVALRAIQQQAEHERLANLLNRLNLKKLNTLVTPEGAVLVGRLQALGQELRAALDAPPTELRAAMRSLVAAVTEQDFISAAQQVERLLPLAEASADRVDVLVRSIGTITAQLDQATFISESLVLPTPLPGFVAEPTTAAR